MLCWFSCKSTKPVILWLHSKSVVKVAIADIIFSGKQHQGATGQSSGYFCERTAKVEECRVKYNYARAMYSQVEQSRAIVE